MKEKIISLINKLEPLQFTSGPNIKNTGVSISLYNKGNISDYSFGYASRENKILVNSKTIFPIASITKSFTAALATQLFAEKSIELDTPISSITNRFKFSNRLISEEFNIIDLLAHRTSLPRNDRLWYWANLSLDELINKLPLLPLNPSDGSGFRKTFQYNNITYGFVAEIIETLSGKSWKDLLENKLIDPLNLDIWTTYNNIIDSSRIAMPYFREMKVKTIQNWFPPASGALWATSNGIAQWLGIQINKGEYLNSTVFKSKIFEQMWKPYSFSEDSPELTSAITHRQYGLGWTVDELAGRLLLHHGGATSGTTTFAGFIPDEKIGVVVFVNQANTSLARSLGLEIFSDMLSIKENIHRFKPIRLYSPENLNPIIGKKNMWQNTDAVAPVKDLQGSYFNEAYGSIKIETNNNGLYLRYYECTWPVIKLEDKYIIVGVEWLGMPCEMKINISANGLLVPMNIHPGTTSTEFKKTG